MEIVCSLGAGVTKPMLDSFQISLRSPCNLVTNHVRNNINISRYDKFLYAFKPSRRRQITHLGCFSRRTCVSQFLCSNDVNEVNSQSVESFISLVCVGLNVCPQNATSSSRKFASGPQLMCKATGRGPGSGASQPQGKEDVRTERNESRSSRESNGCQSSQGFAALASLKAQLDRGAAIAVVDANLVSVVSDGGGDSLLCKYDHKGYEERVTKTGNQGARKRNSSTHASKSAPKYMIENPESISLSRSEESPQASTFSASEVNSKATSETPSSISSIISNDNRQIISPNSTKCAPKVKNEKTKTSSVDNDTLQTNDYWSQGQGLRIRVSNLPNQLSKEEFDALMKSIPGLSSWVFLSNRAGGCRGYCFCEAVTDGDVVPAIEALSQQVVQGKKLKANLLVSPSAEEREGSQAEDLKPRPNIVPKTKDCDKVSKSQSGPKADNKGGSQTLTAVLQGDIRKGPQDFKRGTRTEAPVRNGKNPGEEVQMSQNIPLEDASGLESDDQGVLKGSAILAAMQRAAAAQRAKAVRKRREGGNTFQMKGEDRETQEVIEEGPPHPIFIKQEWGDQIQCLEKLLNDLKQTLS